MYQLDVPMDGWYWIAHTDPAFTGMVGAFEFFEGFAAYAPEKVFADAHSLTSGWFEDDLAGSVNQIAGPPAWVIPYCWMQNGFEVAEIDGGQTAYEDWLASL
jgi:hypothetical protein